MLKQPNSRAFCAGVILAGLCAALAGCRPAATSVAAPANAAWFADITPQAGVSFVQDPGASNRYFMPESMGTGAALLDYDNDGRLDLYLLQGPGRSLSPSTGSAVKRPMDTLPTAFRHFGLVPTA